VITLANRSVGMRCTLLDPQARACVADGRSGDAARHDASWITARFHLAAAAEIEDKSTLWTVKPLNHVRVRLT